MQKKIRVAIMADEFDRRPERTLLPRRLIEKLLEDKSVELTLVHSKRMPDEPLYQKAREILLPRTELPWATRFISFIRFCLTTKERFDIVHWFVPRPFPFFWLFPATHTVVMAHGGGDVLNSGTWTLGRLIFNYTLKWFHKYIFAVIAVSDYGNREIIYAYGIPPWKVHTIYNPVDPIYLAPVNEDFGLRVRHEYGIQDVQYFFSVSRFRLHKNIGRILEAYVEYRSENPNAVEHLVLGGGSVQEFEKVYGKLPDSPYVKDIHFLGYIPTDHMPALYRGAHAYVFISLNEGFGMPVIEAFACGVPVITASTTSLPEVAGDAAIIVDPHDPHALAEAFRFVGNPGTKAELVRRGFARSRFFTWEKTYARTLGLFRELIDKKRSVALTPVNEAAIS